MKKDQFITEEESQYLSQLTYEDAYFSKRLKSYFSNMRIVVIVLLLLIFAGTVAFLRVPKTLNPEINLSIVMVSATLPGATPTDVESLVTQRIEKSVAKVDGIEKITSTSTENFSNTVIQFEEGINSDTAQVNVQNAVNGIGDLPDDTTTPVVKAFNFEDIPIITYSVTSNKLDQASLNVLTENLVSDIENQSAVDRVVVSGDEKQEVQILVSPEKIKELGIDLNLLAASIKSLTNSFPAGEVEYDKGIVNLTIDRAAFSLDDLRKSIISLDGNNYQLGDLAQISQRSVPGFAPSFFTDKENGNLPAITLSVYKVLGARIDDVYNQSEEVIEQYRTEQAGRVTFTKVVDFNRMIEDSFSDLYQNLAVTVVLVFVLLFVFIGLRQAVLAAISIPLTFLLAAVVMLVTGMTLNFLSIFALLLSLGLLVDVTIVVVSAVNMYNSVGKFRPIEVALLVWRDFSLTLFVTTLTTVWAFLPLFLSTGIMGEFLKPLPIVVSSVLIGSVLVGFFIVLPLMVWLLGFYLPQRVKTLFRVLAGLAFLGLIVALVKKSDSISSGTLLLLGAGLVLICLIYFRIKKILRKPASSEWLVRMRTYGKNGIIDLARLRQKYQKALDKILQSRRRIWLTVIAVAFFFVFSVALVVSGIVKSQFFPDYDADFIYIQVDLPVNTKAAITAEKSQQIAAEVINVDGVRNIQTQIGATRTAEGFTSFNEGESTALLTIDLMEKSERKFTSSQIAEDIRQQNYIVNFQGGKALVVEDEAGPPSGADVTIKFSGDDLDKLNAYADRVIAKLDQTEGVMNAKKSVKSGNSKIVFVPDQDQLAENGLTVDAVGGYLRTFSSGLTIKEEVEFKNISEEKDVVLRLSEEVQETKDLENISIFNGRGQLVPLSSLGKFLLKESPPLIDREDQKRVLAVTASVKEDYNANEINQELGRFINREMNLSAGYTWKTGGANEENQKSVNSILQAMLLAFLLIFLTLIVHLNSYRKSFIVLLVIPLAISGVFVMFAIFNIPLSFPALIGILALFGIVINNSIMIIDQINKNHRSKVDFHRAVVEGASSRLEPIMLSSLTTIIGLSPITITQPIWRGLGGAIISGLIFSGAIMLFFIPSVYYLMMRKYYDEGESVNR